MNAIELIKAERERQVTVENYSHSHDDQHVDDELLRAAICYGMYEVNDSAYNQASLDEWPWELQWFKPNNNPDGIRNLVKAGALLAAEIDRRLRLKTKNTPGI